ncbi:MAG: hypothetical protein IIT76_16285, partial [Prevotella sp.]|nr:hypothetical protein [Prevotella sp.]
CCKKNKNFNSLKLKQMKKTEKRYDAPQVEVIEIETQSVLCASGGGGTVTNKGAGTTNMGMSEITDFWHG